MRGRHAPSVLCPIVTRLCVATCLCAYGAGVQAAEGALGDASAMAWGEKAKDITDFSLESMLASPVVSSTWLEQTVETAPSVVSVVTAEQIRALGLRTLHEALQLLAGITVVDTLVGPPEVSIRGVRNPANTLVTLDGQPLNDFYDGAYMVDFPLEVVERIEVIRGPGSSLYGSNAFAGVISLYTPQPDEELTVEVAEMVMPNAKLTHAGSTGARIACWLGDVAVRAMVSTHHSEGTRLRVEDDMTRGQPHTEVPGYTNDARAQTVGRLAIQSWGVLKANDTITLATTAAHQKRAALFGVGGVFSPDTAFTDTLWSTYGQYEIPLLGNLSATVRLFYDQHGGREHVVEQPTGYSYDANGDGLVSPGEIFPKGKIRRTAAVSSRTGAFAHVRYDQHFGARAGDARWHNSLLVGVHVEHDRMPRFSYSQNYDDDLLMPTFANYPGYHLEQRERTRTLSAAYLQDQLTLGDVSLTIGVRLDAYSDFGAAVSPRAGLVWRATSVLSCKFLYGRAFRAPTFKELYDETSLSPLLGGRAVGNAELPPETNNTAELGIEARATDTTRLRVSGFYNRTDNAIELDGTFNALGIPYVSYPGKRIAGAEVETIWVFGKRGRLFVNAFHLNAVQLGTGLAGWEQNNDRRFIDTKLRDTPAWGVTAGLIGGSLPLQDVSASAVYGYVAEAGANGRFVNEAMLRHIRHASFHQVSGSLEASFLGRAVDVTLTAQRSFGRTVPVPMRFRRYGLKRDETRLMLIARVRLLKEESP